MAAELVLGTPIAAHGILPEHDAVEADRLRTRITPAVACQLAALAVFLGVATAARMPNGLNSPAHVALQIGLFAAVVIVAQAVGRRVMDWATRRSAQSLSIDRDTVITEQQLEYHYRNGSAGLYPWTEFSGYRSSERLLILYQKDPSYMYQVLSRDLFASPGDWQRCLALVARKLPCR